MNCLTNLWVLKKNRFIELCDVRNWNALVQIGTLVELKIVIIVLSISKTCVLDAQKEPFH